MDKVWRKILGENEEIKHEFSVGDRYRLFGVIGGLIFTITLVGAIVGIPLIIYYGWYLKRAHRYCFTDKRILIHRGWLSTNLNSVDYDRISEVKVVEPFLDRVLFKTGYIGISTPGTALREVVLKHVDSPYELKKQLDKIREGTQKNGGSYCHECGNQLNRGASYCSECGEKVE